MARTSVFPSDRLKALLQPPFDRAAWEAAAGEHFHVRIANAPPTTSKAASLADVEAFLARIATIGHRFCDVCRVREAIHIETDILFRGAAGMPLEIPCALVARVAENELLDLRFYLDPSPIP